MNRILTHSLAVLVLAMTSMAWLSACATTQSASSGAIAGPAPAKTTVSSTTSAPAWMSDLQASYPDSKYLAAVGVGDTRRDAESDASGSLSRIFNVNISVDSVAQQRYVEIVSKNDSYSKSELSMVQNVGMKASEQFSNLRYSDPYTDSRGRTHVVAYLEREPTAALYKTTIQKDGELIGKLKARSIAPDSGKLQKFALLDTATLVSLNADRMIGQLQIIHTPTAKALASQFDTQALIVLRDAAAKDVTYRLEISGDKDGKIAGLVKTSLSGLKLSSQANGMLSVTGSWLVEPVEVNPRFKSVRWTINISMVDEKGTSVATFFKESRENAISDAEAKAFAYREVEKELNAGFIASLTAYMAQISQIK